MRRSLWILGLCLAGFAPLLIEFFMNISRLPHYQFFPGALAAAGFLAWDRQKELARPWKAGAAWISCGVLGAAFCLLALGVLIWSPWIGAVSAYLFLVGLTWLLGGWALLKKMVPALVMVLTVIPPPMGLDAKFTLFLREIATHASSRLLDFLNVIHSVNGNVIELPQQALLVEEACSGINSVLFITAFTLFFLFWKRRSVWCFLICLPAALAFVVMGNILRITIGTWFRYHDGIDLLSGWRHEALGLVLVGGYTILVMSLEHLLYWPPSAQTRATLSNLAPATGPIMVPRPARLVWVAWVCAIAFACVGVAGALRGYVLDREAAPYAGETALRDGAYFTLPDQIGPWRRFGTEKPIMKRLETFGISSMFWQFVGPENRVVGIAFDYPMWGYHDVTLCYLANGWTVLERERRGGDELSAARLEIEMKDKAGAYGSLWVGTFTDKGRWVEDSMLGEGFGDLWRQRGSFLSMLRGTEETTYRVQGLTTGSNPITTAERESITKLFEESRQLILQQFQSQTRPGKAGAQ